MTLAIGSSSSSFRFWRPIHCRILIRHRSCKFLGCPKKTKKKKMLQSCKTQHLRGALRFWKEYFISLGSVSLQTLHAKEQRDEHPGYHYMASHWSFSQPWMVGSFTSIWQIGTLRISDFSQLLNIRQPTEVFETKTSSSDSQPGFLTITNRNVSSCPRQASNMRVEPVWANPSSGPQWLHLKSEGTKFLLSAPCPGHGPQPRGVLPNEVCPSVPHDSKHSRTLLWGEGSGLGGWAGRWKRYRKLSWIFVSSNMPSWPSVNKNLCYKWTQKKNLHIAISFTFKYCFTKTKEMTTNKSKILCYRASEVFGFT